MKSPLTFLFAIALAIFMMNFASAEPKTLEESLAIIEADPYNGKEPPLVVLKLDDLCVAWNKPQAWQKVADFARERGIKVTFGIITTGLDKDTPEAEAYREWIRKEHDEGTVEFWHHGLDHKRWEEDGEPVFEFKNSGYEHQQDHITRGQQLARENLGFVFTAFGAPFNAFDADTAKALQEDPDINIWVYGPGHEVEGLTVLSDPRKPNLETPVLKPNYEAFVKNYATNRGRPYYVLQGHPHNWNDHQWEEFVKVVDFLQAQKAEFITITELTERLPAKSAVN